MKQEYDSQTVVLPALEIANRFFSWLLVYYSAPVRMSGGENETIKGIAKGFSRRFGFGIEEVRTDINFLTDIVPVFTRNEDRYRSFDCSQIKKYIEMVALNCREMGLDSKPISSFLRGVERLFEAEGKPASGETIDGEFREISTSP